MRIFVKKAFQFDHPAGAAAPVIVHSGFADVPDWVADSQMFALASGEESVIVIEDRQDEVAAETGAETTKQRNARLRAEAAAKAQAEAEAEAKAKAEAEALAAAKLAAEQNQQ